MSFNELILTIYSIIFITLPYAKVLSKPSITICPYYRTWGFNILTLRAQTYERRIIHVLVTLGLFKLAHS